MRVVMFGYQTWGHRTLRALLESEHEVALVVTHQSRTPANCAAVRLSPIAIIVLPMGSLVIQIAAASTAARIRTDQGRISMTGRSRMPPRPISLKLSAGLPVAAPPVQ